MRPIDMLKITLNLVIVYVLGGLLIAFVYSKASPVMYRKAQEEKQAALKTMSPEADIIEKLGDWEPHEKHAEYYVAKKCGKLNIRMVKDEKTGVEREVKECIDGTPIGYIVESYGKGYSSYINVLVAVDNNYVVRKVNILHHAETPGLGDEIERDYFLNQFNGKTVEHLVVVKGETKEDIQAITGATISSRAVTEDAVRNAVIMIKGGKPESVSEGHG
jgi:electron transport complex protein RnfG